jgi:DNA-binding response OmpR family regulator
VKKRILIVDDDLLVSKALTLIIESEGYDVETKFSGKKLLNEPALSADLILLDRHLTDMDGLNICKHLKMQASTQNIPIIIISASADLEALARNAGADDFVIKPFIIRELLDKVKRALVNISDY